MLKRQRSSALKSSRIRFFKEDIQFVISGKSLIRKWIIAAIEAEGFHLDNLNLIFCSDNYLLEINRQYLNHDYYTDIITFDTRFSDNGKVLGDKSLSGDVFISYERILDNAAQFKTTSSEEFHRVIIHGVLHLLGYKDKSPDDKKKMTLRENHYLTLRSSEYS